jgi:hypothetical protein
MFHLTKTVLFTLPCPSPEILLFMQSLQSEFLPSSAGDGEGDLKRSVTLPNLRGVIHAVSKNITINEVKNHLVKNFLFSFSPKLYCLFCNMTGVYAPYVFNFSTGPQQ